jgi:hypothetical protein
MTTSHRRRAGHTIRVLISPGTVHRIGLSRRRHVRYLDHPNGAAEQTMRLLAQAPTCPCMAFGQSLRLCSLVTYVSWYEEAVAEPGRVWRWSEGNGAWRVCEEAACSSWSVASS